jgi:hypothetical protein
MLYTVSARTKDPSEPILTFLDRHFGAVPIFCIDSVFGFVERSTLYGGREFSGPELVDRDVNALYEVGIGLRLPLTNHYVEREEYEANRPLLAKYHREGNAVIVTNDVLTRWIRDDFPKYRLEASVIKNLNTPEKIMGAMALYDTVVLPMNLNYETELLRSLDHKERITLFANAGCALTCPSRICYPSISKSNKYKGPPVLQCSRDLKERTRLGMVDFNIDELKDLGFSRFKVLRARKPGHGLSTGY